MRALTICVLITRHGYRACHIVNFVFALRRKFRKNEPLQRQKMENQPSDDQPRRHALFAPNHSDRTFGERGVRQRNFTKAGQVGKAFTPTVVVRGGGIGVLVVPMPKVK